jgi:hypothetical protein
MSDTVGLDNNSTVTTPDQDNIHYAGFWIRLAAVIIDTLILWPTDFLFVS